MTKDQGNKLGGETLRTTLALKLLACGGVSVDANSDGAFLREALRDGRTDPLCATSYQDDLISQLQVHECNPALSFALPCAAIEHYPRRLRKPPSIG
jgi:hypothetical protein